MIYADSDYAPAAWAYTTRTLSAGSASAPTTDAERFAAAVWAYSPRTLTGAFTPDPFDLQLEAFLSARLGYTVYPLYRPQSRPLPAMTYTLVSKARTHTLRGSAGVAVSTYQLTYWANDYLAAANAAEALFEVLDGYSGAMGTATVLAALAGDEVALYNAPANNSAKGVHQRVCPYEITHLTALSAPTRART